MDDLEDSLRRTLSRRAFLKGAAAVPLAAYLAACTADPTGPTGGSATSATSGTSGTSPTSPRPVPTTPAVLPPEARAIVQGVPKPVLERVYQGYIPGLSGDVVTVPLGFNYFDGGISHSTPWPYTQHVPMVWYGPGIIPKRGRIERPVTSADQAPTLAAMTGFTEWEAPDGVVMEEVVDPAAPKPRLIVTLVWDAAGTYVLGLHPDDWPNLRRLMDEGANYANATVGSAPSSTAPVHATMGTGAFPRLHGVLDNVQRLPSGRIADPWTNGPQGMLLPTFADHYGAAMGDRVEIGTFATLSWHLGMMGTGTAFDGGKRQLGVLREKGGGEGAEGIAWGLAKENADFYRFPEYVNDFPEITSYWGVADDADGERDGRWRGHDMDELKGGFDSPARIPYQTRAIQEVMTREGLGRHEGTDLMFINYKLIDEVGHLFTASSIEMGDSVRAQDAALPAFISFLDDIAGKGQWVLLITADHGHTADREVSGGFNIKVPVVEKYLASTFPSEGKDPVVERVRPGWSFVDLNQMDAANDSLESISAGLQALTKADSAADRDALEPADAEETVILASFPGTWLPGMREIWRPS